MLKLNYKEKQKFGDIYLEPGDNKISKTDLEKLEKNKWYCHLLEKGIIEIDKTSKSKNNI